MSEEEPSGILFQVVAAVAGIILIGAGIYISTHASVTPRRASKPPAVVDLSEPEAPVPPPISTPVPEPIGDGPLVESLEAWLDLSRGRVSRFSLGSQEHEQFRRSLMRVLRSNPSAVETAVRTLLEDQALEPAARALLVNGIGQVDDATRAESTLLGLLRNPAATEPVRCDVLGSLAELRQISDSAVWELIRIGGVPDAPGRAAVEALGILYQKSATLAESQRREIINCVQNRHAKGLSESDIDGLTSSFNALARMNLRSVPEQFRAGVTHRNPAVRQAAIDAAAGLPPASRSEVLVRSLASEPDAELRVRVIRVLPVEPDVPILEAALKAARDDTNERVRLAALEFFARRFDRKRPPPPAVSDAIHDRSRNDPSAVNREYGVWLQERLGLTP